LSSLLLRKTNSRFSQLKPQVMAWGFFLFLTGTFPFLAESQTRAAYNQIKVQEVVSKYIEKKDRAGAIEYLKKQNPRPKEIIEHSQLIVSVGVLFFSDKAQQLHETALTLRNTDIKAAGEILKEALQLEPDNLSIQSDLIGIEIPQGNCAAAEELQVELDKKYGTIEIAQLLRAQTYTCSAKYSDYSKLRMAIDLKKSGLVSYWRLLDLEASFKQAKMNEWSELLKAAEGSKEIPPDVYYWKWKMLSQKKSAEAEAAAQKYLFLCKSLTSRQQRHYLKDPNLCRRQIETESFLKKAVIPGGAN
jgi:hypothetical protein